MKSIHVIHNPTLNSNWKKLVRRGDDTIVKRLLT